jgi:hypothetical protein
MAIVVTALGVGLIVAAVRAGATDVARQALAVLPRALGDPYMAQVLWAPFLSTGVAYGVGVGLAWLLAAGVAVGLAGGLATLAAWAAVAGAFVVAGSPGSAAGRALAGAASALVVAGVGNLLAGALAGRARTRGGGAGPGRRWGFEDPFAAGFAGFLAVALRPSALTVESVASGLATATLAGLAAIQGAQIGARRAGDAA